MNVNSVIKFRAQNEIRGKKHPSEWLSQLINVVCWFFALFSSFIELKKLEIVKYVGKHKFISKFCDFLFPSQSHMCSHFFRVTSRNFADRKKCQFVFRSHTPDHTTRSRCCRNWCCCCHGTTCPPLPIYQSTLRWYQYYANVVSCAVFAITSQSFDKIQCCGCCYCVVVFFIINLSLIIFLVALLGAIATVAAIVVECSFTFRFCSRWVQFQ